MPSIHIKFSINAVLSPVHPFQRKGKSVSRALHKPCEELLNRAAINCIKFVKEFLWQSAKCVVVMVEVNKLCTIGEILGNGYHTRVAVWGNACFTWSLQCEAMPVSHYCCIVGQSMPHMNAVEWSNLRLKSLLHAEWRYIYVMLQLGVIVSVMACDFEKQSNGHLPRVDCGNTVQGYIFITPRRKNLSSEYFGY